MSKVERTATRIVGFESSELDFQLMRSLGAINYGGGAPGEIFSARGEIEDGDAFGWPPAFERLARRIQRIGADAADRGRPVSASDHFLRASMYWRTAEYFTDPFSPEANQRGLASRLAFLKAADLLEDRITPIRIPFEGVDLPGYFMTPGSTAANGRTILILTGFDGTGEELYFQAARAGLERGFNVLIGEGPGQVGALRFHSDLTFRPDYERPIAAMIDVALARPEVDPERLAVYGISFGGYFVIRAGENDSRIRALVVNSPIIDLHRYLMGFAGGQEDEGPPDISLSEVDDVADELMPRTQKLQFKSACRRFGVDSLSSWLELLEDFTAADRLGDITCPTLALVGAGEGEEALAQYEGYCAGVRGPVTRRVFDEAEGADTHCQLGNLPLSNAVIYDWIEETL